MMGLTQTWHRAAAAGIVVVFLVVSMAIALTARPDESGYANPGYNLVYNGRMGTTLYQLGDYMPNSLGVYTYWQPPLYFFVTAAWYKLVGFCLTSTRLVSVFFALLAIFCWYAFVRRLLGSVSAALAAAFVAANVRIRGSQCNR
jgi:4-amino-4-deoxy-L-arabinose transferase-like glycosyltransferase